MPDSPPFGLISQALRQGHAIPFVGSGASPGGRVPDPEHFIVHEENGASALPFADELSGYLAKLSNFPESERPDLTKVAQFCSAKGGPDLLRDALRRVFNKDFEYGQLHKYLATVAARKPLLIVTTNYDDLIERAFRDRGQAYDLVIHTSEPELGDQIHWQPHATGDPVPILPKNLDIKLEETTVIYKMHGTVDRRSGKRDQYVITEDDYIEFLGRMTKNKAIPAIFAEPFKTRGFLFLAYSLSDWNMRVVLSRIAKELLSKKQRKGIKSWSIQCNVSQLEHLLWQNRDVDVYDMTIDAFVEGLERVP
jgi:SIR2-like domain